MSRSRIMLGAMLASSLGVTAACASLLGIDDVGYGPALPTSDAAGSDGGADVPVGDAADACADGSCCVCPADASCVGSCVTRIYSSQAELRDIVAGGSYLYWYPDSRSLYRCLAPNCMNATLATSIPAPADSRLVGLAADDRFGFFGTDVSFGAAPAYRVSRCEHGGDCTKGVFAAGFGELRSLASDDAGVGWIAAVGPSPVDGGEFLSVCSPSATCDGGGSGAVIVSDGGDGLGRISSLALSTPHAFWAEPDAIKTARVDGVGGVRLVVTASSPTGLLVRGGHVYYFESSGDGSPVGVLRRCPADGESCASPELVADGVTLPAQMTGDGDAIYWVADEQGALRVYRWLSTRPLGTVERIAIAEGIPTGMASDRSHIYWSASLDGGGGIYRLAR
ncbi:MAG: hypothetical protein JST00_13700 [Deltaproteobacteria bacterium]|nr:hypothetical protein [Deltaproteobacteria bacterium]